MSPERSVKAFMKKVKGAIAVAASALLALPMYAANNLGMVGIQSIYGDYLQAHTDGEMHASNPHRNEEETWFLVEVDASQHVYALANWRTGRFLSKRGNCAVAASTVLGPTEKWVMISGRPHGFENAVALKSAYDGSFLGTRNPGNDTPCGGEVDAWDTNTRLMGQSNWPGWWVFSSAAQPVPGSDVLSEIRDALGGMVGHISPADVISFLSSLLA